MKTLFVFLGILGMGVHINAQQLKPTAKVEPIFLDYKGKQVKGKKLTVYSEIPIGIDSA